MSSDIAISVSGLSKCYQIYDRPQDRLLQMLLRNKKQYYQEFWALNEASFEVKNGETVGIVGRNGSGKSTLLQIICGTLTPSSGVVKTQGRIAALLELGSGFNPEFTGRENVFFNASILGLEEEETARRFDEIAAFADIGEFIDQPVSSYSSGMVVRLAFAVAINVDPEILIIDEALAVGDELFQRKCFSRIEAIKKTGTTILFVSHSCATIVELCDRVILLEGGEQLAIGSPKQVVSRYQKLIYAPAEKQQAIRDEIKASFGGTANSSLEVSVRQQEEAEKSETLPNDSRDNDGMDDKFDPGLKPVSTVYYESIGAKIDSFKIVNSVGDQVNHLVRGRRYRYTYTVRFEQAHFNVRFGMMIKTLTGLDLGGAVSASSSGDAIDCVERGQQCIVEFDFRCSLNPGTYFLNSGVLADVNGVESYIHRVIDSTMFKVQPETDALSTGVIDFDCQPFFEPLEPEN
ncbi:ABC transporter ATP-binding protein [Oceanicoccus sagamiensis]|uniref:ABC transporter ATP-binding protein n=1 Tax=Oceanicoccus sagamiensis TaxID=716816 RepID=A0A1X9NIS0_9GAMM|nr:ABC transporter ATP-binding protein [Oceanicoccus sagamiensis]ARN73883.1 ABC transporter ATP-binding protein [Oceanicoccus sagamiensis]